MTASQNPRTEFVDGYLKRIASLPPEKRAVFVGQNPLSFAQQRLWFVEKLAPGTAVYNIPTLLNLTGPFDAEAFRKTLQELAQRHDTLRTCFPDFDGKPFQLVLPEFDIPIEVIDLQEFDKAERAKRLAAAIGEAIPQPFDLTRGPLVRATVLIPDADQQTVLIMMHHIISDGWSQGILIQEILTLYNAFRNGRPSPLQPLPLRYLDFAVWQREWLQGAVLEKQLNYWREDLKGAADLELPSDHPRPPVQTYEGGLLFYTLPVEVVRGVRALTQASGGTLFMTLLAGFKVLLHRYSGQEDIVIGSPIANRNRRELEGLIGFFVNTLVMRDRIAPAMTFREVLGHVRATALGAYDHQDLPFEKLVEELNPQRDLSRNPLVQAIFAVQNAPGGAIGIELMSEAGEGLKTAPTRFDLEIHVWEDGDGLTCGVYFSTSLFEAGTIERMLDHWTTLLRGIVANPDQPIAEYPLMDEDERRLVLHTWNQTDAPYPREATIQACFELQTAETPNAVALVAGEDPLTYAGLNARANQWAHWLQELGVRPEDTVGLFLQRGIDMVVAVLAILKAGGAYLPLDPSFPAHRVAQLIEDANPRLVLAETQLAGLLPDSTAPVHVLEDERSQLAKRPEGNVNSEATARSLAYVMYTSGSTGVPKGVCVEHRNVVRLVKNANYAELNVDTVCLMFAPLAFDASTLELWGPLLNGGRLVIYPPELPSLDELADSIDRHGVNTLWLTAGLFHQMAEGPLEKLRGLRQWLAGGDVLNPGAVRRVLEALPDCTLTNGYGPTECTTFSTTYTMRSLDEVCDPVPIGRPLQNARVYVLDPHGAPVPIGVPGELFIGGDGVARGYLNSAELTAERFLPDPFANESEARMYKSGDMVRWREDGTLHFLGRRDAQVKLRGFRIELGEIEAVLAQHETVAQAAVVLREDTPGDKRLAAYVVAANGASHDPVALRRHLRTNLPSHMVPDSFTAIPELPLNANGKLDRAALPAPDDSSRHSSAEYVAPRTDTETRVAELWQSVLSVERVGIHDNFFDSGGHSLALIQLAAEINQAFSVDMPLQTVFSHPTVEAIAQWLDAYRDSGASDAAEALHPLVVPIRQSGSSAPLFCIPPAGGTAFPYYNLAHYLGDDQPVYALQDPNVVRDGQPCATIEEMAGYYVEAIRSVQPHGPYRFVGWSFGGIAATEVALRMIEAGERVALLGLIEAILPRKDQRTFWERVRNLPAIAGTVARFARSGLGTTLDGYHAILHNLRHTQAPEHMDKSWRGRIAALWRSVAWSLFLKRVDLAHVMSEEARLVLIRQPSARDFGRISKANIRALTRYAMPTYPGKAVLFRGDHQPKYGHGDEHAQGWDRVAEGGVDVHVIPGDHFSIIRNPQVIRLAEAVRACLDSSASAE